MRILKIGGTQIGTELISLDAKPEPSNRSTTILQDKTTAYIERTARGILYRVTAMVMVDDYETEDAFDQWKDDTLYPTLVAASDVTVAEYEDDPETLIKSVANCRFDDVIPSEPTEKSMGAHDFNLQIIFVSDSGVVWP